MRTKTKNVSRKTKTSPKKSPKKKSPKQDKQTWGENCTWQISLYIIYTPQRNTTGYIPYMKSTWTAWMYIKCLEVPPIQSRKFLKMLGEPLSRATLCQFWECYIYQKMKNRFPDGMRKVWKRNQLYSCFLLTLSLGFFISCKIWHANIKSFIIKLLFQDSFKKLDRKILIAKMNNRLFIRLADIKSFWSLRANYFEDQKNPWTLLKFNVIEIIWNIIENNIS